MSAGIFIVRLAVLSQRIFYCNGMTHTDRMRYWADLLTNSPIYAINDTSKRAQVRRLKHAFVCVSWLCHTYFRSEPRLKQMASDMTFLINENNNQWAGVSIEFPFL